MCLLCHANLKNVIASKSNEMNVLKLLLRSSTYALAIRWFLFLFYFLVFFFLREIVWPGPFVIFYFFLCSRLLTLQCDSHSSLLNFRLSVRDDIFLRPLLFAVVLTLHDKSWMNRITIYGFMFLRFCCSLN